ncbi:MAG: FtsX-like permease family protein [Clostridiales bacterium]|nr:FtsX-like permease family protein [Clostridiales bacterium]
MVKLIKANIRKDRNVLLAFLMILILSSLLLHTGLFTGQYSSIYDEKCEKTHEAEVLAYVNGSDEEIRRALDGVREISEFSIQDMISPGSPEVFINDSPDAIELDGVTITRYGEYGAAEPYRMIDLDASVTEHVIYLNSYYAKVNHIHVGDRFRIRFEVTGDVDLTVGGIFEALIGGNAYGWMEVMVDTDTFADLQNRADEIFRITNMNANKKMVKLYCAAECTQKDTVKAATDAMASEGIDYYIYERDLAKEGYIAVADILSGLVTAFAIVVLAVCLIMIVFTINNNIDRDIKNIGALRAVGHTVGGIRAAMAIEYVIIGLIGAVIGCAISYVTMPVLDDKVFQTITGVQWVLRFCPGTTILVLSGIAVAMTAVVFLSTIKLKNLHPATALRFGLKEHSFAKNYLPLKDTKGSLNLLLALKSMLQSQGQNIILLGVMSVVAFMIMFSGVLFYNSKVDPTSFMHLINGDNPDGYFNVNTDTEETHQIMEQVSQIDGISQVYGYNFTNISIEGNETFTFYTDKPEYLDCGVYEGAAFREDNECVIGKVLAKRLGVTIGDEIEVKNGNISARYIITGFQQAVYNMGERIFMSEEGVKRLHVDPNYQIIRFRVSDPSVGSVDRALSDIKALLGSKCSATGNWYDEVHSGRGTEISAVSLVVMIMVALNVAIILLVIKILLKTIFIKKEKEFGIKKAVGFTSKQLKLQLSLSLLPVTLAASVIGAAAGYVLVNPLLEVILSGFGVEKVSFLIFPVLILITVAVIGILIFSMTYVMSGSIRRVSAYELISE